MSSAKQPVRPNIILIMADQLPASMLHCYGNAVVQTPSLDRLAESGVRFASCYCNSPLCAPSRASLFSGRLISAIGTYDNGCELPATVPTFLHHLRARGYRTTLSGKAHFIGPDQLHGFEERLTTDIYPASTAWTPSWDAGVSVNPGSNVSQVKESGVCTWNLQLDYDEETLFRALEFLRYEVRDLSGGDRRPFFLNVSFTHPHEPFVTTQEWWDRYGDEEIPSPSAERGTLHQFNQWLQIHHGVTQFPLDAKEIRAARRAYYGMTSYLDSLVGRIVDEVDRLGLRENTVIMFLSDHGEMLGDHGMWFKRTFYDQSARVPLIVSWPSRIAGGRSILEAVSLVDVYPTLCEAAAATDPTARHLPIDGTSLWQAIVGENVSMRDEAILEYCGEGVEQPMRMIRRGDFKYVAFNDLPPLLFDLRNDPGETMSLAGSAAHASIEAELATAVCRDFDFHRVHEAIVASQRRRAFINTAMSSGRQTSWDWSPPFDSSRRYVRKNAQTENAARRYPPY